MKITFVLILLFWFAIHKAKKIWGYCERVAGSCVEIKKANG